MQYRLKCGIEECDSFVERWGGEFGEDFILVWVS